MLLHRHILCQYYSNGVIKTTTECPARKGWKCKIFIRVARGFSLPQMFAPPSKWWFFYAVSWSGVETEGTG